MAEIKRITPAEVVEAYAKTELTVARGSYIRPYRCGLCGCGMGAYAVAFIGFDPQDVFDPYLPSIRDALLDAGFSELYQSGFGDGFDGRALSQYETDEEYHVGFRDGRAAWDAVSKGPVNG